MRLDQRADLGQRKVVHFLVGEPDGVGIAHADAGQVEAAALNLDFVIEDWRGTLVDDRNLIGLQPGGSHVDSNSVHA